MRTSRAERPRRADGHAATEAAIAEAIRKANPQMAKDQAASMAYVLAHDTDWADRGKLLHEYTGGAMGDGGASTSDAA